MLPYVCITSSPGERHTKVNLPRRPWFVPREKVRCTRRPAPADPIFRRRRRRGKSACLAADTTRRSPSLPCAADGSDSRRLQPARC